MRGLGQLRFYKIHDDVELPAMATTGSACFDFKAHLIDNVELSAHDCGWNHHVVHGGKVRLSPRGRMLIPTGLIADIPKEHSIRIHPRSGLAFTYGLCLSNQEGVVDSDYKEEIYIPIYNSSNESQIISHGMRVAQGELVAHQIYHILETKEKPKHTSGRQGGFGSTGE